GRGAGGGEVGMLRVEHCRLSGRALIQHGSFCELAEVAQPLRRRTAPASGGLRERYRTEVKPPSRMAAMASTPPIAPADNKMRLLPSRAADFRLASSFASASAPIEMTRQSIPLRKTAGPCPPPAPLPATSAMMAGVRPLGK